MCASNFVWYTDRDTYCNAKCPDNVLSELSHTTEEDCCLAECNAQDPNTYRPVCSGTYQLITNLADFCDNKCVAKQPWWYCPNVQGNIVDCNDDLCAVKDCVEDLISKGYLIQRICGDNSYFYDTKREFCLHKLGIEAPPDSNLQPTEEIGCIDNQPCTDQRLCCVYSCIDQYEIPLLNGGCDTNFNVFENAQQFCLVKCADPFVTLLTGCSIPFQVCTKAECC